MTTTRRTVGPLRNNPPTDPLNPIHNHHAGVLFLTLSPADIETAVRSGLTLMLQDVCLYTRRRITEVRVYAWCTRGCMVAYARAQLSPIPQSIPIHP